MNRVVFSKPAAQSAFGKTTQNFPEVLSDPLTRALMAADGVDAEALEAELREVAARLPSAANDSEEPCTAFC
jgi:hypothetical protein